MQHVDFRLPRPGLAQPLRFVAALAAIAVIIAASIALSGGSAHAQDPNERLARCQASKPANDPGYVARCFLAPNTIQIWTSGPGPNVPREIENTPNFNGTDLILGKGRYVTYSRTVTHSRVADPDNPGGFRSLIKITDPDHPAFGATDIVRRNDLVSLPTGPVRRNDLFVRLTDDNGERLTYGDLTGLQVSLSPTSSTFRLNMANALYSGRTGKGLHEIDHPTRTVPAASAPGPGQRVGTPISGQTVPVKVCPTSVLGYSTWSLGGYAGWYDADGNGQRNFIDDNGDGVRNFNDIDEDGTKDEGEEYTEDLEYTTDLGTPVTAHPCVIDAAAWRLLTSGSTTVTASDPLPDLHLTFAVPAEWSLEDSSVYLRIVNLSSSSTCTPAERDAGNCDMAFSTWNESYPWAFLYRINSDGERCPVYQPINPVYDADGNDISDAIWQSECELAGVTDDPHTGGKAIRMGFTLLDDSDVTADPATPSVGVTSMFDVDPSRYADLVRYDQFNYVRLSSIDLDTATFSTGTFRFLRPDGSKSEWFGFPQVFTVEQLRAQTQSDLRPSTYNPAWFDRFPAIEFVPTEEETAYIEVEFFGGDAHDVRIDNEQFDISGADGYVEADDLPDPRPTMAVLPSGQLGLGAARGEGPAAYAALHTGSAAIAVHVADGSFTIGDSTCIAVAGTPCDLSWSRQEAWEAGGGTGTVIASDPVKPIPVVFFPPANANQLSIFADVTSNTGTLVGGFNIENYLNLPEFYNAGITGALEQDADGIAAPGAQVPLTIGFQINAGDNEGSATTICTSSSQDPCTIELDDDGSYLVLSGPATWENGSRRLNIDGTAHKLACSPNKDISASREFGSTCYVVTADGTTRPKVLIASDAAEDVTVTASITAADDDYFHAFIRRGASDSFFGVAFTKSVFGTYAIKVATVKQLAEVTISRTPVNGIVPSAPIPIRSETARIRVGLFNENGGASQLSDVSSISLTAVGGGTLSGYGCSKRSSCTLSLVAGDDATATNNLARAVQDNPALITRIDMTYNAPTAARSVRIRAVVIAKDGGRFIEDLPLVISGSATELAIGTDMPRVHSSATADDDRDTVKISVTAQDAGGNPAPIPATAQVSIIDVDENALATGRGSAVINDCDAGRYKCSIIVTVTAPASNPLASGAYTAKVVAAGIKEARAMFAVAGPAASLSIDVPDQLPGLAETFTATASAVDAAGVPVADGTLIVFSTAATGGGSPSAVVTSPPVETVDHDNDASTESVMQRRAASKNGQASANITVVSSGVAVLTASTGFGAGFKSASEALDTRAVALAAAAAAPVLDFNTGDDRPSLGSWATYRGETSTTAADLLGHAEAPEGAAIVWLWNGVQWIHYGEAADGTRLPGSDAFFILPTDTILFGG